MTYQFALSDYTRIHQDIYAYIFNAFLKLKFYGLDLNGKDDSMRVIRDIHYIIFFTPLIIERNISFKGLLQIE